MFRLFQGPGTTENFREWCVDGQNEQAIMITSKCSGGVVEQRIARVGLLVLCGVGGLGGVGGCFGGSVGMDDDASTALPWSDARVEPVDAAHVAMDVEVVEVCGDGECGPGESAVLCPEDCFVPGTTPVVAVGGYHNCARTGADTVWCWGYNRYGQLGDGSFDDSDQPREVLGLTGVTDVSAGELHSCALRGDGTVWCWGRNHRGQVGIDPESEPGVEESAYAKQVAGIDGVVAVSAGGRHTCAVRVDHSVWCWGANVFGQLGDGTDTSRHLPREVVDLQDVAAVSAGGNHTCALQEDGSVWCWGQNERGQLGDGVFEAALVPGLVAMIPAATLIDTGAAHTCVMLADGGAWCWGDNASRQLGLSNVNTWQLPTRMGSEGLMGTSVAAGDDQTCVVRGDGTVWCWGGVGIGETLTADVVQVDGFFEVIAIGLGVDHGCGTVSTTSRLGGGIWCWGKNELGQLGDGTHEPRAIPVRVSGF